MFCELGAHARAKLRVVAGGAELHKNQAQGLRKKSPHDQVKPVNGAATAAERPLKRGTIFSSVARLRHRPFRTRFGSPGIRPGN